MRPRHESPSHTAPRENGPPRTAVDVVSGVAAGRSPGSRSGRPEPAQPRSWAAGERCLAYHPRLHPKLGSATVMEDFTNAQRRWYVDVRFEDGIRVTTHKQNVYPLAEASEALRNADSSAASTNPGRDLTLEGASRSTTDAEPAVSQPEHSPGQGGASVGRLVKAVRSAERISIREVARRLSSIETIARAAQSSRG
jgi:hypothetical protein